MVGALLEPIVWSEGRKAGRWEREERTAVPLCTSLPVTLCATPPRPGDTVFTQVTTLAPPGSCQDDKIPQLLKSDVNLLFSCSCQTVNQTLSFVPESDCNWATIYVNQVNYVGKLNWVIYLSPPQSSSTLSPLCCLLNYPSLPLDS